MKTLIYIITNYLYISKNNFIETQRINERWFKKQKLETEWREYSNVLTDRKTLYDFMVSNDIQFKYDAHINYKQYNTCECCGSETEFKSLKWGYKKYCSRRCAAVHTLNLEKQKETMLEKYGVVNSFQMEEVRGACQSEESKTKRTESIKKTNLERYGVEFTLSLKDFRGDDKRNYDEIVEKIKKTNLERCGVECALHSVERRNFQISSGNWLGDDEISLYRLYRRRVWSLTGKQKLKTLENIENRGRNKYHLDHKYSVFEGFRNNIPPYIIANIRNLEMLPEAENIKKGKKCSITLEELYALVFCS